MQQQAARAAPWREVLLRALKKNSRCRHSRYMQVATVTPSGRPANRTVVFRGFLAGTDALTFVTDARSSKVGDIAHSPWAEVAWYLPDTREQFRLAGRLTLVDGSGSGNTALQEGRLAAWRAMSDPGRQQFLWPHPSRPRSSSDDAAYEQAAPGPEDPVVPDFCLVCLAVEAVDHLELKSNQRHRYTLQQQGPAAGAAAGAAATAAADAAIGEWVVENVNP